MTLREIQTFAVNLKLILTDIPNFRKISQKISMEARCRFIIHKQQRSRSIIRVIIIGIAGILLSAAMALAVVGTAHDFSILGGNPCSYCHSIHNVAGGLGRPSYMGAMPSIMKVYSSLTMNHKPTKDILDNSDAPLCLTCHDEATIGARATGPPADATAAYLYSKIAGSSKNISLDLSNDHPVGFVFEGAAKDLDIKFPSPESHLNVTFGINNNEMWCSTCHNPHGGVEGTKFLNRSNGTSGLCFECHVK